MGAIASLILILHIGETKAQELRELNQSHTAVNDQPEAEGQQASSFVGTFSHSVARLSLKPCLESAGRFILGVHGMDLLYHHQHICNEIK